jgi:hypothetical protein
MLDTLVQLFSETRQLRPTVGPTAEQLSYVSDQVMAFSLFMMPGFYLQAFS